MDLVDTWLTDAPYGFSIATPREAHRRGGHMALAHPQAVPICKALKARGIIPDFRPPNVIRVAPAAMATTYEDVWSLVSALREIVDTREYERYGAIREAVA